MPLLKFWRKCCGLAKCSGIIAN